jgi:hypothetical protein
MHCDIDEIISEVRLRLPNVVVEQLQVRHPADDDGIWYFAIRGDTKDIQLESSLGACPFLVEHTDSQAPTQREVRAESVDEAIKMVVRFLEQRMVTSRGS